MSKIVRNINVGPVRSAMGEDIKHVLDQIDKIIEIHKSIVQIIANPSSIQSINQDFKDLFKES
jgi:hypothetical protein